MKYTHLKGIVLPWVIEQGLKLKGTREIVGPRHNPVILAWGREVGLGNVYTNDEIPWCGLFVAVVAQRAKKAIVSKPLWARNWSKFGVKVDRAGLGDVLVFKRGNGSHVGFYIAEDATCYHVLGGNQNNTVNIMRIAKNRTLSIRRPIYNNQPKSVKPYYVAANGIVSINEA